MSGRSWRKATRALRRGALMLAIAAVVLASPVLVPLVFFHHGSGERRVRKAAAQTPCSTCGMLLGIEAMRLADDRWKKHVAELHRQFPDARLRLMRVVRAVCVSCGARYKFEGRAGILIPTEAAV